MDSNTPSERSAELESPASERRDEHVLIASPLAYHVDTSFDHITVSPGRRSPAKTPTHTSPLPPLPEGSDLIVKKRRRLTMDTLEPALSLTEALRPSSTMGPATVNDDDVKHFINPSKGASPIFQRRTPSLHDLPIPTLPPVEPVKPKEESSIETYEDLKFQETQLDIQLRQWKRLVQLSSQARKYEIKHEDEKLRELVIKWRDAAQQAANYLLNQASERINRMGGFEEYQRRQKDRAARQSETSYDYDSSFNDSSSFLAGDGSVIDVEDLSPDQREAYDQMKAERQQIMAEEIERREKEAQIAKDKRIETEKEEEELKEISMEYMLKQLNIDPLLLFPEGF